MRLQPHTRRADRLKLVLKVVKSEVEKKSKRIDLQGMDKFSEYLLVPRNLSDPVKLEELIGNEFLTAMSNFLTDDSYIKALQQEKKSFQKLSDDELTDVLTNMVEYDPKEFVKKLRELAKSLEARK